MILLGQTLLVWVIAVILTTIYAQNIIRKQIDQQLYQYMDMAVHTLTTVIANPEITHYFAREPNELINRHSDISRIRRMGASDEGQATNLWFPSSHVVIGDSSPAFPEPDKEGLKQLTLDGAQWRVLYKYSEPVGLWIGVGVNLEDAQALASLTPERFIVPIFIIMPLSLLVLMVSIRKGIEPLNLLAAKISQRNSQDLTPLQVNPVPSEMQPVVQSLNELLGRVASAIEREQRFTANAAHELKTPLAAIKAEVQRHQRSTSDSKTGALLANIDARVSRAVETVSQLLTLSRLDNGEQFEKTKEDLGQLVIEVLAELGALAMEKSLVVEVPDELPQTWILGNQEWLMIMVRNLIDNAIKYSPKDSVLVLNVAEQNSAAQLTIVNQCKPIDTADLARLKDRFYRPVATSEQGVGLGLSIVDRIAKLHGGEMSVRVDNDASRFIALIELPMYV